METYIVRTIEILDQHEREWLKNGLSPLTPAGQVDKIGTHSATRTSPTELRIITTSGEAIRFVVKKHAYPHDHEQRRLATSHAARAGAGGLSK